MSTIPKGNPIIVDGNRFEDNTNTNNNVKNTQEQIQETTQEQKPAVVLTPLQQKDVNRYSNEIIELAQQKYFELNFYDQDGNETKRRFLRRKALTGEIEDITETKKAMYDETLNPKQARIAFNDYYYGSAKIHLRDNRTGKYPTKEELRNTIFQDFRKIIDACEYASVMGFQD